MTHIDRMNRRLGEELGFATGDQPRFMWKYSPEVHYFYRPQDAAHYQRFTWAARIGKCWMICQWRRPEWIDHEGRTQKITPENWQGSFGGEFPYPDRMYGAHPETALAANEEPTMELTVAYIASLRQQMEKDYAQHLADINADLAAIQEETDKQFFAEAEDWFPYGWANGQAHEPGTRGAHISFGGV